MDGVLWVMPDVPSLRHIDLTHALVAGVPRTLLHRILPAAYSALVFGLVLVLVLVLVVIVVVVVVLLLLLVLPIVAV